MKRKFNREFSEDDCFSIYEKTRIGVVGIGRGAGTSFVATSLAIKIASADERATAFIEIADGPGGKTWVYDLAGIDKRFAGREYVSMHGMVRQGNYIRGLSNMDRRVNWALVTPDERNRNMSTIKISRLINNVAGDVVVCDLGTYINEDLLEDMDVLVCVVDPKPSRLIGCRDVYRKLKQQQVAGRKLIWVVNKVNGGINRRCFRDYMKIRTSYEIPLIKEVHFYAAEYNCRFPIEQREIEKAAGKTIEDIVKELIL